jgi:hypothetical protein
MEPSHAAVLTQDWHPAGHLRCLDTSGPKSMRHDRGVLVRKSFGVTICKEGEAEFHKNLRIAHAERPDR